VESWGCCRYHGEVERVCSLDFFLFNSWCVEGCNPCCGVGAGTGFS
jgi:hypothetical protein